MPWEPDAVGDALCELEEAGVVDSLDDPEPDGDAVVDEHTAFVVGLHALMVPH